MPKINTDATITVQDPALVSRKRSYPDVLLRTRKINAQKNVVKSKDDIFITDEFETTTNQYIEIASNPPIAAGNIGEIQFNNTSFNADPNLKWVEFSNTLNSKNINVNQHLNAQNFTSNNLTVTVNSYNLTFNSNGSINLPNYTIPATDGENFQTLVTDGSGNVTWQSISSQFDNIVNLENSTGTVIHDFNQGQTFYHTNIQSNFTTNITNLNLPNMYATNIQLILVQQSTPYITSTLQINGITQTINWIAGILPVGNPNEVEVIIFSVTKIDDVLTVYGQLISYI